MEKKSTNPKIVVCLFLLIVFASCKKEGTSTKSSTSLASSVTASPVTLGLYEYAVGVDKRIFIPLTKIGTKTISYLGIFDTGSTGMTLDAADIIPASMITSSGITFTGDSTVVNGITITSQKSVIAYGGGDDITKEYGYLAYAAVTIGDANGKLSITRTPFFLYYKIVDGNGQQEAAHSADVFGVGPGVSYSSNLIASPLSYYSPGTGLTSGFKLATMVSSYFTSTVKYVPALLTIGLTSTDLASASGFIMHPLTYYSVGGYSPEIPATITYGSNSTSAEILFDTGTPSVTIIEDSKATNSIGELPVDTKVTVTTNKGFVYAYTTTSTGNLTEIENPNVTGDYRTIFSLDFFISNEFLTDYAGHQIGLKND
ncbi:hypothetical protein KXD93_18335 [Mucilaginibacter sp. BJC16-A38]|uniref:hypothetical protein n=1 Tax=Mucilaginibacter phenanthrenivorans TaxID=1234842 RepID=UPI0021588935|nr:hypothetical protein [Mucilaginibacter phenanthrenivorans]MCR8559623.1 hypothetical protein [Mucilaginibacter phenanthrenivorans]